MKSLNNDGSGGAGNNNWLGFTLAPHMKMEAAANTAAVAAPPGFCLPSTQLGSSALCYGVAENGVFYSPLSVMPLKSDGSLCIMEALSRSHSDSMMPNPSPKLENFLGGGAGMCNADRDAMVLSLDSAFYAQEHDFTPQNSFYPIYQTTTEEHPKMPEDEIPCLKRWMDQNHHVLEHHHVNTSSDSVVECGNLQSLTLTMSPGSQSSCVTASRQISPAATTEGLAMETKKRGSEKLVQKPTVHRKSIDTFGQRTSQYRGVTRHRWTGRYEAHLWDNSCKKEGQTRKGRQVYLGGYDMEEKAARAYDLAALKYWGTSTHINFQLENYHQELEEMKNMSRQEYVAHLRRRSSGFSRGASMYRGVTRHHQHGRWQARIGRVAGNKDLYLGTFSTQEEAAEAYDIAAIKFRGVNAVTNFDVSRYDVEKIMASNTLPTGDVARRVKERAPNVEGIAPVEYNTMDRVEWNYENASVESLIPKTMSVGNYQNPPFSFPMHDVVGMDHSIQAMVHEPNAAAMQRFSDPSSLVTSLNSSREASPDKNATFFNTPSSMAKFMASPSNNLGSWIPASQLRTVPLTMAHQLPGFSGWEDA